MRKVKVELEADVAGFVRPVDTAKKSVDDLGDKVDRLDEKLSKIPADAAKAGAAMKLLDGDVKSVGKTVNDLGDKQGAGLTVLDSKIRTTRAEVRKLADEFVKTGDSSTFKKLGESQGLLQALMKTRKEVASAIEGGVSDAASSPSFMQIGGALGAALAVPIIAAVGGAVTAVAGAGVAGLGIAGAIMGDPERFKAAWGQALGEVKSDFIDATKPFTGPTLAAIASIGPLVASWHIDTIFKNAAQFVDPLVRGVSGLATGLVHGVGALVEKGGPAVNALSDGMAQLGRASESALKSIADGAEGGALALRDTATAVSLVVEGVGKLVQGFEVAYKFIHDHPIIAAILTAGMSVPISLVDALSDSSKGAAQSQDDLRKAAEAAGHAFSMQGEDLTVLQQTMHQTIPTVDSLAGAMVGKIFSATMNLDQALLGVHESLTRLDESFLKNGLAIDKHTGLMANNTAKGQSNREAVLASVTANMQLYQAQLAAGMTAMDAAANYDENTKSLEANLRKAGLNAAQIDDLIGKYKGIPGKVDSDIAINGLTAAINSLSDLIKLINGIHDKTVWVDLNYTVHLPQGISLGNLLHQATGGIRHAAKGMIVGPSDPGTLIGEPETGGEANIPLRGISQMRAMGLAQVVGNSYGFNVSTGGGGRGGNVSVTLYGGDDLTSAMLKSIRTEVRTNFGGNVQVALGPG